MKTRFIICLSLACALQCPAEDPTPEIAGLQKAAAEFVTAYNKQDATAIAALFTEDGEMADLSGTNLTSGRDEIQARYEQIFSDDPLRIAIEVDSVRFVAPNLAIEDGTFHLTPADDESAPPRSTTYTAVLIQDDAGAWRIASTRSLKDVTEAAGHLASLADALKGEWTYRDPEGVRLDLAFGWDSHRHPYHRRNAHHHRRCRAAGRQHPHQLGRLQTTDCLVDVRCRRRLHPRGLDSHR
jgi:uncharacterized protein (TIGR02246 family)